MNKDINKKVGKRELNEAIKIAKDFEYPDAVIEQLKNAQTSIQISNILKDAQSKYL